MKQICVIGVGYVGLVTAACFADLGNRVVALDVDDKRVENLKNGSMPIYEPGLEELVKRNVKSGRLSFTTSYAEALEGVEYAFIAVGTPSGLLSFFYGFLVRARVFFYRAGFFRSASLPCKVISVGNITQGGTGKTPFVILLAELFRARQIPVAILSRGYKGSFSGPSGMVSDGRKTFLDARQAGDEPSLLARRLPGVPVFIGRERRLSGRAAVDRFQVQAVILDDGFQHLPLERDLNFLLLEARLPFGNGWLFPRGVLREPPGQAGRADAIILTKADQADNILKLKDHLHRLAPGCPIFAVRYAPVAVRDFFQRCFHK